MPSFVLMSTYLCAGTGFVNISANWSPVDRYFTMITLSFYLLQVTVLQISQLLRLTFLERMQVNVIYKESIRFTIIKNNYANKSNEVVEGTSYICPKR
jgi:hypothetical protein